MIKDGTVQKGFATGPIIAPSGLRQQYWEESLTQKYALGATYMTDDGRVFKYALNGAVALAAGELIQTAKFGGSVATVQTDLTPAAFDAGVKTVTITTVTDATVKNLFQDGTIYVSDGPGQGESYKCTGNTSGAAGSLTFTLQRGLTTAWTTSTRLTLMTNIYKSVITCPVTTPTGMAVGIPQIPVTIAYYCWLQTWGMTAALVKVALTMGVAVDRDLTAAGSIGAFDGALINEFVGSAPLVAATTDSGPIFLRITPW